MSKNKQEKQDLQRKQEDQALTRASIWVGAAVVLEMIVFFLNRNYINFALTEEAVNLAYTLSNLLRMARIAGVVVLAAGIVWAFVRAKKGQCPGIAVAVAVGGVAVSVCAHVTTKFQAAGVRMLFLLVPVWAAVAMIYYLYQREFFVSAVACVLSAMGIWFVRACGGLTMEGILCLAGMVVVLAVALLLKKNHGELGGKRILPEDSNYPLVLGTCAAALVMPLIAVVIGAVLSYYLIFVVAGWMFALLVYYTVKMM